MGKRGPKAQHTNKRIKLGYLMPLYAREMIVEIANATNKNATDALIDMIHEEHEKKSVIRKGSKSNGSSKGKERPSIGE